MGEIVVCDLFSAADIVRFFDWLNHSAHGFTELAAFHPDYKPGRENFRENYKKNRFTKVDYAKTVQDVLKFVERYAPDHMCCGSVNPRQRVRYSDFGGRRRTDDAGIQKVTRAFMDFDPKGEPTDEQIGETGMFLETTNDFFGDLGIRPPVKAFSGRGYHFWFALPVIVVSEHPDIAERLNAFRRVFLKAFGKELAGLDLKVDYTFDLSRLVKIAGTRKPGGRRLSTFPEVERREDSALRDYLLRLNVEEKTFIPVDLPEKLPAAFEELLAADQKVRELWEGVGKIEGDLSCSGFDFSLVKYCLGKGITDIRDLTAILALRPKGGVRASGKGEHYIRWTIAAAIKQ